MTKGRNLLAIPFIVLLSMATKCGFGYPEILNTLDARVEVSVVYENGRSASGEMPAGARLLAPEDASAIEQIEVRSEGRFSSRSGLLNWSA